MVVLTKLVGLVGHGLAVFGLLGTTSLAFVLAGALLGWPGLLGAAAAHAAWTSVRTGALAYPLLSTALYAFAGGLVYWMFRRAEGVGRGFPDIRSLALYGAASGAGALLTSFGVSLLFEHEQVWRSVATWSRSTIVSVWVFGPSLLILGKRLPRRWLAPIPGEVERTSRGRYELRLDGGQDGAHVVREPEPPATPDLAVGALMLAVIASISFVFAHYSPAASSWMALFYLVPIYWATRRHRLTGGLVAAAGTGAAVIAVAATEQAGGAGVPSLPRQLDVYGYLLGFLLIAVLLGQARERETGLFEALESVNRRLRSDLDRVVRALTGAVEAKDLYTEGHLRRVSSYALEVGRRLGLSEPELEHLRIASALHDVGKIGVPEHILNKPGPLDPHEREVLEHHPEIGARILTAVEGLSSAAPLVLHHQERWDGRRDGRFPGYPAGITGEAIPLGARIIAVVDAFDAMTTDRAYRRKVSPEVAIGELRRERGKQFDPQVVDVFLDLLDQRPWE